MIIMGQLIAFTNSSTDISSASRHFPQERRKKYTTIFHQGKPVCQKMFLFLHGIGKKRMRNIKHTLLSDGVSFRVHGNTKRLPKNALSMSSVEYVIRFMLNYTEQHGLLLPGRVPGYSRDDIKLLPSSVSKRGIWKVYPYSSFCRLWKRQLPQFHLMKPMTDLCWTCMKNSTAILRSANSERQKSSTLEAMEEHLRIVHLERSYYKTKCDECKRIIIAHFSDADNVFEPPSVDSQVPANSTDIQAHYSFDYAQQVHYPSDPMQPGPIYFLVPRKCSVFGINCEAIPRQKDIAKVANDSAVCNYAQLNCTEDGSSIVPIYNWTNFFATKFRKITGIKKPHHFRFTASEPGEVYTKVQCDDSAEKKETLLKKPWPPDASELPSLVMPKGLSAERQWYLYESIREFCPPDARDLTCSEPTIPKPGSRAGTPAVEISSVPGLSPGDEPQPPPTKKSRVCGNCKRVGHNRRTCPDMEQ